MRDVHSSLLDLDDTHGRIGVVQPLVHHQEICQLAKSVLHQTIQVGVEGVGKDYLWFQY